MTRHELLRRLHALARPRNYLEIGVDQGRSLSLSRVPSIGVDPAFRVTEQQRCDLHLVRATSDDFFARPDPINHLRSGRNPFRNLRRGRPMFGHYFGRTIVDLAFIDGLHHAEFALRDFMNVERFAHWGTLIVIDDVLPRNIGEATREFHRGDWTGDVYKLIELFRRYRPDLTTVALDTEPTGVLVVLGADPSNRVLHDSYDAIERDLVSPDPQAVPASILRRQDAMGPETFLGVPIWRALIRGRNRQAPRSPGYERIRAKIAAVGSDVSARDRPATAR